jgi:hypothetical protein
MKLLGLARGAARATKDGTSPKAFQSLRRLYWRARKSPRSALQLSTQLARESLWIDSVRSVVGRLRFLYFAGLRGRLRTMNSAQAYATTIRHNLRGLNDHRTKRMQRLIEPLHAVETLDEDSHILVVGPRTESDLLMLRALGFRHVRGLDLISYSPWVDLGDMHRMPYADDTWDAVMLAWCLTYSREPHLVAREVVRVAKPGALVGVGLEYSTLTPHDVSSLVGYEINTEDGPPPANSVADIRALFENAVDHVYFDHDAPCRRSHASSGLVKDVSQVVLLFSIRKGYQDKADKQRLESQ